ncbi:type II toxin-antitoxin system RelB/DinJ family antitoxin [Enterococcus sp. AZ109]|uniref:type II toxin-antitoxin system RelB/DinJ family antitoxin n=1 Tax=Enterococcus sp. AZ109 TaxID=2774634 RepID=UPI003F1F84F1
MATIRVDDNVKKEADRMFDEIGLNTSVAVKMFLTKFIKTGKFPFEIEIIDNKGRDEAKHTLSEATDLVEPSDTVDDKN